MIISLTVWAIRESKYRGYIYIYHAIQKVRQSLSISKMEEYQKRWDGDLSPRSNGNIIIWYTIEKWLKHFRKCLTNFKMAGVLEPRQICNRTVSKWPTKVCQNSKCINEVVLYKWPRLPICKKKSPNPHPGMMVMAIDQGSRTTSFYGHG